MRSQEILFPNADGLQLAARLEWPLDQHPINFAIFAHCFTCSKSLAAVRYISRALTDNGIAVLRFDFTGLGDSEGDFSETNFSANISDIVHAASFLRQHYQAPSLLIGHSLGGAAVLQAAWDIPEVKAVSTIGAPYDPEHVIRLLEHGLEDINHRGFAEVQIGGRPFRIKKQFLDDLGQANFPERIASLQRALLVLHSPQDTIVAIENAAKIYQAARHPKSFISLDRADHLLTNKADAIYTGNVIASWATRYLPPEEKPALIPEKEVAVRLGAKGFTTEIQARHHHLVADEPEAVGGDDFGPSPYELLSASLGACTAMTLQMYARRKGWDLQEVEVHLAHGKDYPSHLQSPDTGTGKIDVFERWLTLAGDLDEEQRQRLLEIANRCPVHRTLENDIEIRTKLHP